MPTIFDNIESRLLASLRSTLEQAKRADFCTGYFRLRGWSSLADLVDHLEGTDDSCCRVLVGMQGLPHDEALAAQ